MWPWRQIVAAIELARSEHSARAFGQIGFLMGGHRALWPTKQCRPGFDPMPGIPEASDIASVVTFQASDDERWIIGRTIPIDGGYTAQ